MRLWGGRFAGKRDPLVEKFSESFSLDQRLITYDLRVNLAYVQELGRARVLPRQEVARLTRGLEAISRYVQHHPHWAENETAEDVHSWVEGRLEREVGALARKLRTGRSRNDLVATETRLYAKDAIRALQKSAVGVLESLLEQARRNQDVILPGYTHLQPAQPILFSHYLLAYAEMLLRDVSRLEDCYDRADELPMGAGALAGTSYPIDRVRLGRALGFSRVARNSLDATSDRDFVCELLFACSLTLVHLSRLAEDFIIYSTPAFGYLELADAYATGSSLMPQKKNADTLELIRGKVARMLGMLTSMLVVLKGLPLGYDRDLQEDKHVLFDGVDAAGECLTLAGRVIQTIRVHPERMKEATAQGFLTATEVADALVGRGVAFGQAHEQVGKLVKYCVERNRTFAEVTKEEARSFVPLWDKALAKVAVSPELSLRKKNVIGGTAPRRVSRELANMEQAVRQLKKNLRLTARGNRNRP
jgi:argininosuccinate lyase